MKINEKFNKFCADRHVNPRSVAIAFSLHALTLTAAATAVSLHYQKISGVVAGSEGGDAAVDTPKVDGNPFLIK